MAFNRSLFVFISHCQNSGEEIKTLFFLNAQVFLQIAEITKLVVFYFLECISPLIGVINIYTLSTNRNKYNIHCCRMSIIDVEMFPLLLGLRSQDEIEHYCRRFLII